MIDYSDLIGIPFVTGGRDKNGLDCYGLAMEVFRRYGIKIPEYNEDFYNMERVSDLIRGEAVKTWTRVPDGEEPPVPSLVTVRFGVPEPYINHVGVYIGGGRFIHTREKIGVNVASIHSPAWRRVIQGYYVYEGVKP